MGKLPYMFLLDQEIPVSLDMGYLGRPVVQA